VVFEGESGPSTLWQGVLRGLLSKGIRFDILMLNGEIGLKVD